VFGFGFCFFLDLDLDLFYLNKILYFFCDFKLLI
jgi:hypothetical protein